MADYFVSAHVFNENYTILYCNKLFILTLPNSLGGFHTKISLCLMHWLKMRKNNSMPNIKITDVFVSPQMAQVLSQVCADENLSVKNYLLLFL